MTITARLERKRNRIRRFGRPPAQRLLAFRCESLGRGRAFPRGFWFWAKAIAGSGPLSRDRRERIVAEGGVGVELPGSEDLVVRSVRRSDQSERQAPAQSGLRCPLNPVVRLDRSGGMLFGVGVVYDRSTMPRRALYYPHVSIGDPDFLFESLLYWDRLATILPFSGFRPHRSTDDLNLELAALEEAYISGITPSRRQKEAVHERLAELIQRQPPKSVFEYRPQNLTADDQGSVIWAKKLSPKTVRMLETSDWIRSVDDEGFSAIAPAAANIILGTLAQECSSPTLPAITNDAGAFRTSCDTLLADIGASAGLTSASAQSAEQDETDQEQCAFITTAITSLGVIPGSVGARELRILRELRQEAGFDAQRRAFADRVDEYLSELRATPVEEHGLVADDWNERLTLERNALRDELKAAKIEGILDAKGLVGLILAGGFGGGGVVVGGVLGGPVGAVVGLGVTAVRASFLRQRRRREILSDNWTSWLYTVERGLASA